MCFVNNATHSADGWPVVVGAPEACDRDVADVLALSDPMPISAREVAELPAVADEATGIVQGPIPSIIQEVIDRFGGVFHKEFPAGFAALETHGPPDRLGSGCRPTLSLHFLELSKGGSGTSAAA